MNFPEVISHYILSLLIFFPVLMGAVLFIVPASSLEQCKRHRHIALFGAIVELLMSLHLVRYFIPDSSDFQFAQSASWLPAFTGIKYIVGVDGLSLSLVLLSTFFTFLVVITTYSTVKKYVREFLALVFLLEASLIGIFVSLDVVLFYFFWELSLIPVYFMVGFWGEKQRIKATLRLFIYGVAGSLFMLLGIVFLYTQSAHVLGHASTGILDLYQVAAALPCKTQCWLLAAFVLAFGIKVPIFPFYSWMPDIYEQAPPVYTIFSGVILKLATYALIRFGISLFPLAAKQFAYPMMVLALIGILYGSWMAFQQKNIRRMMAFSSLSHLGFIVLGLFSLNQIALEGSLYQMINHAVVSGALFILFQCLYEKEKTASLDAFGGLAKVLPWFSFFFGIIVMGSVALPGTGSFIGEWLILMGTFQSAPVLAAIATTGVVFGAAYMLWATYKILFGQTKNEKITGLRPQEVFQLVVLTVFVFGFGFASSAFFQHSTATLSKISEHVSLSKPYESSLVNLQDGQLQEIDHIKPSMDLDLTSQNRKF